MHKFELIDVDLNKETENDISLHNLKISDKHLDLKLSSRS